jgi:hypothetical protein
VPIDNLAERLARLQSNFQEASADGGSMYDPPPDDDYQALIHEFDFFEAGPPTQAFLKMRFQVQHHPEYGGRFADTVYSLEDPDRIDWLKKDLATLVGREQVEQLNDGVDLLPGSDFLESLLDVPVLIRVKRPGRKNAKGYEIVNVYLQQRLGDQQRPPQDRLPVSGSDVPNDTSAFDETAKHEAEQARQLSEDAENPLLDAQERREALLEAGCICEDPVAVQDGDKTTAHVDCPLPGHAPF